MRKLLIGLGVLVVILVGAAFAGPLFIPTDSIKADIAAEVQKATGRTLSINGKLSFRVLPAPGVSVDDVALSNAAQGGETAMVRLEGASVEVALLPLVSGNVQIKRIVLRKPSILLEQYADGTNNWTFAPQPAAAGVATSGADSGDDTAAGTPPIQLDDVVIEDGTLTYKTPDQSERVENINMSLGAGSLLGPYRGEGSLMARGFDVSLKAAVGELVNDKATPINLRLTTAGAKIGYSGVLSGATGAPRVSGQIEVRADDLSKMIGSMSGGTPPAALRGKALEFDGTLTATQTAVNINDLALRLGDDSATGAIDVALGDNLSANVVLNMSQLDLDRLLAETQSTAAPAKPAPASSKSDSPAASSGAAGKGGFSIPENISASIETKIDTLVYRDGVIRQVFLNADITQGAVNISRASAQLPGGSSASLVGLVSPTDAGPKFDGQAEVSSDNLRSLLKWAGTDVSAVPAERLRKMAGSVTVGATQENITLTDIDVSVDVSRLRGGVAIALRDRPGFGVGLSLDKLNLDAYLPDASAVKPDAAVSKAGGAAAEGQKSSGKTTDNSDGLAALNAFDAILQLKVGELVYRAQKLRGINLDSTIQAGMLEVRDASVANLEGAKVSAKGRIDDLAGAPKADLAINIDAPDADKLLALANVTAPSSIGPGKLNGTFRGDMQNLVVDTSLQALGARLNVKGTVAALALPPRYDLKLDLKHADASVFFAQLGGDKGAAGVKTGPLSALINARGDLNTSAIDANIGVGPGKIVIDGKVGNLAAGAPTGALTVAANHPDMVAFVQTFANAYKPALADAGPFALKASVDIQPQLVSLQQLEGRAGPVSYAGTAQMTLGGERPDLTAELKTSEIIVDWFLPVSSTNKSTGKTSAGGGKTASPGGSKANGGERWSRERLDLSALQTANADIELSAPAITYTDIRVDQPQLAVTVRNGVLDLKQLSGKAFGGGFSMTGQVADRDVPTMRYALDVQGADAAKFLGGASKSGDKGVMSALELLFPVSNVKLVSGTLGADLNVASRGRSEFEMISNLGGDGAMQFTNAVVDGIDVCRISNQLDNLNGLEGFLGLATSAQGGQTKIESFNGRFDIANGVATLPQQQLNAECAAVAFSGTTNLPKWLVDIRAKAGFPAHPEFPGLVVEQKGSLDAPNTRLVNLNQINDFVASKAVGTVLRKFLPGASQQQQQPSSGGTTTQPQSQPTGDPFKSLLEGLIKRR
ncbi:MAG: AsmA family protein [Alphaproteobacteria bacterium]|nr:AsmA family protein [Alphaproteobacteria bacterium]